MLDIYNSTYWKALNSPQFGSQLALQCEVQRVLWALSVPKSKTISLGLARD